MTPEIQANLDALSLAELRKLLLTEINRFIQAVEAGEDAAELKRHTAEIYALLLARETAPVEKVPPSGPIRADFPGCQSLTTAIVNNGVP
ncbi:MAG TPA: hypothetical protein VL547_14850 [Dinghuibacter sp.]|uniref:hypothetical protein n=1 Tax=Dinghuibacter sp. TaxID=2024697 RepID=UPI002C0F4452|nr:hypothetical protein [Dinghuibacter sp.]HTJ13311.1 hypothetical protein [Dinghuibacter sp.]